MLKIKRVVCTYQKYKLNFLFYCRCALLKMMTRINVDKSDLSADSIPPPSACNTIYLGRAKAGSSKSVSFRCDRSDFIEMLERNNLNLTDSLQSQSNIIDDSNMVYIKSITHTCLLLCRKLKEKLQSDNENAKSELPSAPGAPKLARTLPKFKSTVRFNCRPVKDERPFP